MILPCSLQVIVSPYDLLSGNGKFCSSSFILPYETFVRVSSFPDLCQTDCRIFIKLEAMAGTKINVVFSP